MKKRDTAKQKAVCFCCFILAACLFLPFLLPAARFSVLALCNQAFAASERVNAYAYDYFQTPENQTTALAWALTAFFAVGLSFVFFAIC